MTQRISLTLIQTLLFISISFHLFSQEENNLFKAIREDNEYRDCDIKPYKGLIEETESLTFRFDDRVIINPERNELLNTILRNGVIYPELFPVINFNGQIYIVQNDSNDADTSIVQYNYSDQDSIDQLFKGDSLTIFYFRGDRSTFESNQVRTYKFLVFQNGVANPTEYFIELKNIYATKNTDSLDFIRGAKLCRIWSSSLLI